MAQQMLHSQISLVRVLVIKQQMLLNQISLVRVLVTQQTHLIQISWVNKLVRTTIIILKFLWSSSWYNATNASQSNFFGYYAGNGATNASNSNFIGAQAGATKC
jgi:hypothetical protein